MKKRKPLPIKRTRVRKGNHPSNPYAEEAKMTLKLEDRPGYPFAARKEDLSDEVQLGHPPPSQPRSPVATEKGEPIFVLRASNPFSGMVLRFMANASTALGIDIEERDRIVRTAAAMDAWQSKIAG